MKRFLADEAATIEMGRALAAALVDVPGAVIFLEGDLGAGKTTLARSILRGLGVQGTVRSPTYTLLEPYELELRRILHVDLYRIADPDELDQLGLNDYPSGETLWLVEWPQRGLSHLPAADLEIRLQAEAAGRNLEIAAQTALGRAIEAAFSAQIGRI